MSRKQHHEETVALCTRIAEHVDRGLADQPCEPNALASLRRLARTALGEKRAKTSMCSPSGRGETPTYGEIHNKACLLRAITGARLEAPSRRPSSLLATGSAATIVFLVAAHAGRYLMS